MCLNPRQFYQLEDGRLVSHCYGKNKNVQTLMVKVGCGHCVECLMKRSREWALRIGHEIAEHEESCVVTLTYSPENLPYPPSLSKREVQLFIKRLRKSIEPKRISFYAVGEYGSKMQRPHYHVIIFGHDFPDKYLFKHHEILERQLYLSEELRRLWPHGFVTVGHASEKSAAYIAEYVQKKQFGKQARENYVFIEEQTGQVFDLQPEFNLMSTRPALGKKWFEKYYTDVYPHDRIIQAGKERRPPRYYDRLYAKMDPIEMENIKEERYKKFKKLGIDNRSEADIYMANETLILRRKERSRNYEKGN